MGEGEVPPGTGGQQSTENGRAQHTEQRPTRTEWQRQRIEDHIDLRGATRTAEGFLMLLPYTLLSPENQAGEINRPPTSEALRQLIDAARRPNGTIGDEDIASLTKSPFWNDLIEDKILPSSVLDKDPVIHAYLLKRSADVIQADQEFRQTYPEIKELFQQGVERAVQEGYMPSSVLDHTTSALNDTAIQIVDPVLLKDDDLGEEGIAGQYSPRQDITHIASDATDIERVITTVHEMLHKLSGGRFSKKALEYLARDKTGFMEALAADIAHTGLTEAITHHFTLGLVTGDLDTLDPDQRFDDGNDDMRYYAYRKLLSIMIDRSGGVMHLKSITRASFEDNSQVVDRVKMVREARAAYGARAFSKLDILYRATNALDTTDPSYHEKMNAFINRIQQPVVNADGTIKQIGTIDITGLE